MHWLDLFRPKWADRDQNRLAEIQGQNLALERRRKNEVALRAQLRQAEQDRDNALARLDEMEREKTDLQERVSLALNSFSRLGDRSSGLLEQLWKAEAERDQAWRTVRATRLAFYMDDEESTEDELMALTEALQRALRHAPSMREQGGLLDKLSGIELMHGANSPGVKAAYTERMRQIHIEGFTEQRDDAYPGGVLAAAGACYAYAAADAIKLGMTPTKGEPRSPFIQPPRGWPFTKMTWKPEHPLRMLAKAAALIAAEYDRYERRGNGDTVHGKR